MLKATACETIPHCGMTLAVVRNSFLASDLSAMARDYRGTMSKELSTTTVHRSIGRCA